MILKLLLKAILRCCLEEVGGLGKEKVGVGRESWVWHVWNECVVRNRCINENVGGRIR